MIEIQTIVNQIKKVEAENAEREFLMQFCMRVSRIMSPFKSGEVLLEIEENFHGPRSFIVTIQNMGTFRFPIDPFEQLDLNDVISMLGEIFRERYVEPEDHIILGLE